MANVAVIDLGTNTFHILIARLTGQEGFEVIYRERSYVYLGGQGIDCIGLESFQRGISTLKYFASLLLKYQVKDVKAIGTAALRSARNGQEFVTKAMEQTGINISIISGDQEALYIAKGISKIYTKDRPHLVMDIGGGSVEYIIGSTDVEWYGSINIGISVLYKKYMLTDPISQCDLDAMYAYLHQELLPLKQAFKRHQSYDLIGAAGTFEVLAHHQLGMMDLPLQSLDIDQIRELYAQIIPLDLSQRKALEGIPSHRGKYLVVAMALIIATLDIINLDDVYVSSYSLKEGVLFSF